MRSSSYAKNGFTIVELLIVIVIIGILAAITIISFNGIQRRASIAVVQANLTQAENKIQSIKVADASERYPADLQATGLSSTADVTYQYTYTQADNSYCLTIIRSGIVYNVSSANPTPTQGACVGHSIDGGPTLPVGYEAAPTASGASISLGGYSPIQPSSCPSTGGSWIKVPGNSLYGLTNGFCVQQYAARNISSVATSQATGARWTALTMPAAKTAAEAVTSGSHLLSEAEWMTIAANAAMQPQNWSGGAVGSGTLPTGSSTSAYGGVALRLSNGQTIYFDTGSGAGYASNEWTCYTGNQASSCALAAQYHPIPANAYHTDQFGLFTNYNALTTSGSYYYGDPRYANPSLASSVTLARNTGLGYLRTSYAAGSSTLYNFSRGTWTGASSSGMFTLYMYTIATYAHSTYGFRAAY